MSQKELIARFMCLDCGVDTSDIDEYYMVHDSVWDQSGMNEHDGMLCIGCIETRLGRTLKADDFSSYPINMGFFGRSERFLQRLESVDSYSLL